MDLLPIYNKQSKKILFKTSLTRENQDVPTITTKYRGERPREGRQGGAREGRTGQEHQNNSLKLDGYQLGESLKRIFYEFGLGVAKRAGRRTRRTATGGGRVGRVGGREGQLTIENCKTRQLKANWLERGCQL